MRAEVLPSGNVRITHALGSIVVTRAEAEAASRDPKAAAALVREIDALRR